MEAFKFHGGVGIFRITEPGEFSMRKAHSQWKSSYPARVTAKKPFKNGSRQAHQARQGENMREDRVAKLIIQAAFDLHKEAGPGLFESVYEFLLADMLRGQNLFVERQKPIPICFRGKQFDEGFRADLVVEGCVLVELKSIEALARVHRKQVLTYLRLSQLKLGLLINFGASLLKGNVERLVNGLDDHAF